MHDNLKTIPDSCFLLGSYVYGEKSRTRSHVKVTGQGQGHFSEGSRSLGKVMTYSVAGSEILSPTSSFSSVVYCFRFRSWRS